MDEALPHTTPADPVAEAIRRIRAHGERVTVARTEILRALAAGDQHLTADQTFARVNKAAPGVHRTTIYRALDALERLGLVTQTRMGVQEAAGYRLSPALRGETAHHPHVICRTCGKVREVASDLLDEVARRLAVEAAFCLDPTGVALTGHCADCADSRPGAAGR